jgi:hypothetical protein
MEARKEALFQQELANVELLTVLRHALDFRYRHLCQAARADWERLFGKDPADSCVTVRVATAATAAAGAVRGSGFLKSRRPVSKSTAKSSVPSFAH